MAKGECNCGAVAFEADVDPTDVYICHCSICRRFTGANGIAVVVVDNSAFRWVRGEDRVARWSKPGADWSASFCERCGSATPGPNDEHRMFIPAGSISEGGENLRVAHHIFVDSRAAWDEIGDHGKQHRERIVGPA
jgi:hypothetical protein